MHCASPKRKYASNSDLDGTGVTPLISSCCQLALVFQLQCSVVKGHLNYADKANTYLFAVGSAPQSVHEMVIALVSVQLGHRCYHLCDKQKHCEV